MRKTRKATSRLGLAGSSGSFVFSEAGRRLGGARPPQQVSRAERVVLREVVRRFVPVLRRAVDLRGLDLRAVDLRPDDRRVVLRDAVLRPVLLRPVDLRPVLLRPEVLCALEDLRLAPVLPVRSRRFVRR